MRTSDFDYHLPRHHIAQTPMEPRDHSRMLVLYKATGQMDHRHFYDLPEYLGAGDLLVFNDSRVIPARLYGFRTDTGGRVELLLIRRLSPGVWQALARPGRRLKTGARMMLEKSLAAVVLGENNDGSRRVWLEDESLLEGAGQIPLPPYIHTPLEDPERYQVVYSRVAGSVAAPTAGLHFTHDLLQRIQKMGVRFAFATLHVGLDTFQPVQVEDPREHTLHGEWWELSEEAAREINEARKEGRRVVCVGTTAVRLVEQAGALAGEAPLITGSGWTNLFILPNHKFHVVNAMLTNFHLPRSTLLMLMSAFAGRERVLEAYHEAIAQGYRFYSFGDSMLIL